MSRLNPLFEVEVRGRFRRPWALLQIAGALLAGALLLGFLIYSSASSAAMTVTQARAQGVAILGAYRVWGGALYFGVGLLMGAMSLLHEKNSGTFEHLLLCPLGAPAIVRGKVFSALAFTLLLQVALLPLLVVMGLICLLTPGQILWVVALHYGLSAQGVTLGILGAVRAKTIGDALARAVGSWLVTTLTIIAVCFCVAVVLFVIYMIFWYLLSAIGRALGMSALYYGWLWVGARLLLPLALGIAALALGFTGIWIYWSVGMLTPLIIVGQWLGLFCLARWAAWQLHSPHRELLRVFATQSSHSNASHSNASHSNASHSNASRPANTLSVSDLTLFFLRPAWHLTPAQVARFPLIEGDAPLAPPLEIATTAKTGKRLRVLQTRWMGNLNPVLWLDLQRCLSLRAPHPGAQIPLLLASALGGSMALAAVMATLASLVAGGAGEARLGELFEATHWILCYGALASGPLFATTGYVIERRSMMLHELRLTLLSARGLWWGKFAARWIIPLTAALPGLALIAFFADNMGEAAPPFALLNETLLVGGIAAWSVLACLWLSYHAPNPLAAALWTLGFAVLWGGVLWSLGARLWAPLAVLSPLSPLSAVSAAPCALAHGVLALGAGASIWWKLKRLGFG